MAKAPTSKPASTPSAQTEGVASAAPPAATQPPAPPASLDGEAETRYRVRSAIKYGGKVYSAGAELILPADIAATLAGRVEAIG